MLEAPPFTLPRTPFITTISSETLATVDLQDTSNPGSTIATLATQTFSGIKHSTNIIYPIQSQLHATSTKIACSPLSIVVGLTDFCTATVIDTSSSGASNPTGTITFSTDGTGRFVPTSMCALSPVPAANVSDCTIGYNPTAVGSGTQNIGAVYSGDTDHSGSTATPLVLVVSKATPMEIGSALSGTSIIIGGSVVGSAGISGGFNPTGGVTYTAYSDPGCTNLVFTSANVPLGTPSHAFYPATVGTFYWMTNYGGDVNNNAVATICGPNGDTLAVTKATPTITGAVSPSTVTIGSSATDLATISGGYSPSGTVTYTAYSDSSCAKLIFTSSSIPRGTSSAAFTPSTTGTYFWIASYDGDSDNNAVATTCGAAGQALTVSGVVPENVPSLILGLDPTLFYVVVALVAVFVVIVAVAVTATERRTRVSNIPG